MEVFGSPPSRSKNASTFSHKRSIGTPKKDLWFATREGSVADVESALVLLKKNGGNVNSKNAFGLTPLHIATWRNHIPIVTRLLAAGADPDVRDGESGWGSLHRAFHFGHLAVASVLLNNGASVSLEDSKSRTPIDLLSGPFLKALADENEAVTTEVFTWGSGANYQLGTGNADIQKLPVKVDTLHGSFIKFVSASKFHSVAVTSRGEVYTWGFGRGGRLGHPDFDIHSGQAAVITPRLVTSGLVSRRVKAIAAAKHHTVLATEGGEVFTWGSNREGQLGYTVDTQPTPRRVTSLKSRVIAVAAANKHTAVVSDSGEIYTWGCNKEGQLGYGTSNSASNYTPRIVDYLKNKAMSGVSVAKYHTIVLGSDGEVFTWGHRMVTPKRVIVTRNLKKGGSVPLKFHRMERLHVSRVAAGVAHSLALTDDGTLFYWVSSDSELKCRELYHFCGKTVTSISAGKYWSAVVTNSGDVFMWDAKKNFDKPPNVTRVIGVKRATAISVGETHLMAITSLYHPLSHKESNPKTDNPKVDSLRASDELEEFDESFVFEDASPPPVSYNYVQRPVPTLKSLCEKVAMEAIVEPRNSIQMLELADSIDAADLKKHCEDIAVRNLDYILTVSLHSFTNASQEILVSLESILDNRSSEPWCHRRLPTPTATSPLTIDSEEEEDIKSEHRRTRSSNHSELLLPTKTDRLDSFLLPKDDPNHEITKQVRALRKKLQQIEMLEEKKSNGYQLDDQQLTKLQSRSTIEASLSELGFAVDNSPVALPSPDARGTKKQKKKTIRKAAVEDAEIEEKKEEESVVKAAMTSDVLDEKVYKERLTVSKEKKKGRKGGLSMFLSGALDERQEETPGPGPAMKAEGPAWGGAKICNEYSSLREIQKEQRGSVKAKSVERGEGIASSKAITFVSGEAEKSTPPWASGTPPLLSRPSFRDIQIQQGKKHHTLSHSPKTSTSGFAVGSPSSPSDPPGMNRWFRPELDTPTSTIRNIQIEEKAIKDLKRFYSTVKIVKLNPAA